MTPELTVVNILAAGGDPLSHVLDKPLVKFFDEGSFRASVSMNLLTLFVAAGIWLWLMLTVSKAIGTGSESEGNERYITKGRLAQLVEVVVLYLRDSVIRPQLGHDANKFMPFLLSLFFFIWVNNLFGLIPFIDLQYLVTQITTGEATKAFGGTATGRLGVTAGLAAVAFIMWNWHGIKSGGVKGWLYHFTGHAPWYLWPIMIPVELMGLLVKPAALALRLFANMTAGHILLGVLIIFVAAAPKAIGAAGAPISVVAFGGAVAIFFLEIFVATLQAFIFMFLTTLFIAQLSHHEHDDHAMGESYDEDHPATEDRAAPVSAY